MSRTQRYVISDDGVLLIVLSILPPLLPTLEVVVVGLDVDDGRLLRIIEVAMDDDDDDDDTAEEMVRSIIICGADAAANINFAAPTERGNGSGCCCCC